MTADIPTAGRESVNVILDAVVAHVPGDPRNVELMNLALARLAEVEGAYGVTVNDADEVSLDLSNLVGGAMVAIARLVQMVAEAEGTSREEVVADLRAWLG